MNNVLPAVLVEFALPFEHQLRVLMKKYRHVRIDVQDLVERLQCGEILGDKIKGLGHAIFKVRMRNRDSQKGKSGGYRIIYYLKTKTHIILLAIYSKLDQSDISQKEIRDIIS